MPRRVAVVVVAVPTVAAVSGIQTPPVVVEMMIMMRGIMRIVVIPVTVPVAVSPVVGIVMMMAAMTAMAFGQNVS